MKNKEIRDYLADTVPEASLFESPSFDNSIIGISEGDRVVYDYDKMVEEFAEEEDCSLEDAMDFIDYNTIRSLSYVDQSTCPIIIYPIRDLC